MHNTKSQPLIPTRLVRLDSIYRRRQTEIQRAVAEAELELCAATANTLHRDLAEASEEDGTEAKSIVAETEEKIGGGHARHSSRVAARGFGEAAEMISHEDDGSRDGQGTALEPGEVPV